MSGKRSSNGVVVLLFVIVVGLLPTTISSAKQQCNYSDSCNDLRNITYPYPLKGRHGNCRKGSMELDCENDNRTSLYVSSTQVKYYVKNISYSSLSSENKIQLIDSGLDQHNKCSIPLHSVSSRLFHRNGYYYEIGTRDYIYFLTCPTQYNRNNTRNITIIDISACNINSSSSVIASYNYAVIGVRSSLDFPDLCTITTQYPIDISKVNVQNSSVNDIHQSLLLGFTMYISDDDPFGYPWYKRILVQILDILFDILLQILMAPLNIYMRLTRHRLWIYRQLGFYRLIYIATFYLGVILQVCYVALGWV